MKVDYDEYDRLVACWYVVQITSISYWTYLKGHKNSKGQNWALCDVYIT